MAKRRNLNIADTTLTDGDSDEEEVSGKLLEKQVRNADLIAPKAISRLHSNFFDLPSAR